ncbi:hypothetical protein HNQ41_003055 [Texcoconibacillus texcoconensis]|uniref:Uncharacterized protein n=1 Tax=Texcoconibacillus texcoconensis TaxID=1095777 RepID=A0A840QTI7_9BACI|nr:hypothetical protein [Texcoconibacillus texcoconensis]
MVFRIFFLLLGFGFSVSGGISLVAYLNLLTAGYSIIDYFMFITVRIETIFFIIGIFLIWTSIYFPFRQKK